MMVGKLRLCVMDLASRILNLRLLTALLCMLISQMIIRVPAVWSSGMNCSMTEGRLCVVSCLGLNCTLNIWKRPFVTIE